eukprot:5744390-Amphidinium_carterae.2
MDMTINIKKMRGDIVNFSQKLNHVLRHATKPGGEAHSIIRRAAELNNFRFFAQLCNRAGIATLDNLQSSTTSGWKTSTDTSPRLDKGRGEQSQGQHCTKSDDEDQSELHQWISNYFNSTYTGTDEDNKGTVGGVSNYEEEYNEEN